MISIDLSGISAHECIVGIYLYITVLWNGCTSLDSPQKDMSDQVCPHIYEHLYGHYVLVYECTQMYAHA